MSITHAHPSAPSAHPTDSTDTSTPTASASSSPPPPPPSSLPTALSSVLSSSDHFSTLSLPLPCYDALHDVDWPPLTCPPLVQSAFRCQSLLCHPDKHPLHAAEATAAWERVLTAREVLSSYDSALAYATAFLVRGGAGRGERGHKEEVEVDVGRVVEVEREKERRRRQKADALRCRLSASLTRRKEREAEERRSDEVERAIWGEAAQRRAEAAVGKWRWGGGRRGGCHSQSAAVGAAEEEAAACRRLVTLHRPSDVSECGGVYPSPTPPQ